MSLQSRKKGQKNGIKQLNTKPKIELEVYGVLIEGEIVPMLSLKNLSLWLKEKDRPIQTYHRQTLDRLSDFFDKENNKALDDVEQNVVASDEHSWSDEDE